MNRNVESHFAMAPSSLDMRRSAFDRSHNLKTTFNAGLLYPIYLEEVLPGDTFNVDLSCVVRMTPNVHPPMDNCYLETFFFFVPNRLVWSHAKEFFGENSAGYWVQPSEYNIPFTIAEYDLTPGGNVFNWPEKSLWDYMGFATKVGGGQSSLPGRAYALIFNEWFRDQDLQNPANVTKGDSDYIVTEDDNDYVTGAEHYLALCPVNKYHDYFTSARPGPQKGVDVKIPVNGMSDSTFAPVRQFTASGTGTENQLYSVPFFAADVKDSSGTIGYRDDFYLTSPLYSSSGSFTQASILKGYPYQVIGTPNPLLHPNPNPGTGESLAGVSYLTSYVSSGKTSPLAFSNLGYKSLLSESENYNAVWPLYVDLGSAAATINQLRTAFQVQRFLEIMLNGSRYTEIVRNFFGVVSPDARLQRPEYLGGGRQLININQVVQTSSTDVTSPQANVAAYSLTCARQNGFRQSFTEHGMILGLCCVRTDHTYQQGVERNWSRRTKWDFYFPVFANLGNQPIRQKEIFSLGDEYATGGTLGAVNDTAIFGYQEAWAEYRFKQNRVTGQFRSNATGTLDSWHYADYYSDRPYLSDDWVRETPVNIDRTLAVSHSVSDQFIADFHFRNIAYRVMPVYSIPGLADHH